LRVWELPGRYPKVLDHETAGVEAKKVIDDANELLDQWCASGVITANAVFSLFAVRREGDDLYVIEFTSEDTAFIFHMLRQQIHRPAGKHSLSLADFIATDVQDYMGCFAVSVGQELDTLVIQAQAEGDDYSAIMMKAVADRLAEAFAEHLHERIRTEFWGYAKDEVWTNEELIAERYVGIRPAPGYPACPDHMEKDTIFKLLDAQEAIGVRLTESFAMHPASSVSGWYFGHPDSRYFGLGRIGQDQVKDYANRKGLSVATMEKWLAPSLGYEPK
jgi:5-methyltetrahydrofolate--homocysteine methyltransferase